MSPISVQLYVARNSSTSVAVQLVALVQGRTGEFYWLFIILAGFAAVALTAAAFLPQSRLAAARTA